MGWVMWNVLRITAVRWGSHLTVDTRNQVITAWGWYHWWGDGNTQWGG